MVVQFIGERFAARVVISGGPQVAVAIEVAGDDCVVDEELSD